MSNNKSAEDKIKSKFNLPNSMSHGSLKRVAPRSLFLNALRSAARLTLSKKETEGKTDLSLFFVKRTPS